MHLSLSIYLDDKICETYQVGETSEREGVGDVKQSKNEEDQKWNAREREREKLGQEKYTSYKYIICLTIASKVT